MANDPAEILDVFDRCCDACMFPMLDNGYVYLAATRLSLYWSKMDWAMVVEVFGFSPRAGIPNTCILTFARRLHDRDPPENYIDRQAYERYLANHPNNEFRSIYPVHEGQWQDAEIGELIAQDAREIIVREHPIPLPSAGEDARHGIHLEEAPRVQVFELCRFLADIAREEVLATFQERRVSVLCFRQPNRPRPPRPTRLSR